VTFVWTLAALFCTWADPAPFAITVVDEQTGRGVPLVELRTVNNIRLVTDSAGLAAFKEPGLDGQSVFFYVKSHGYEFTKDGFGYHGLALKIEPGGSAKLALKRMNVAERLYRVTGAGIYRDTVLLGGRAPIREPLLNAQVLGSDSVVNAVYRDKIYWFWGDTNRPSYPLGNFHVPGATSLLPAQGGLDPERGIDLAYFLAQDGFAKETCRMPGNGPTWISGLVVLHDTSGRERMFAQYAKIKNFLEVYERGLVEFNDQAKQFEKVTTFPKDSQVYPEGHPFLRTVNGVEYVYFASPYPLIRVRAEPEALGNLARYEAYSCLAQGSRLTDLRVDRDSAGRVRYGWKTNTPAMGPREQERLAKIGALRQHDELLTLRDFADGRTVTAHSGSVAWNPYRKRWVMIALEANGTSMLGEVWYAEADTPLGPWVYARKVASHEKYSFYNPKHHAMLDKQDGRIIFFEGTYSATFSGNNDPTPLYDYNQVMYKLDLDDERLNLPVPVYRTSGDSAGDRFAMFSREGGAAEPAPAAFFALDRPARGTVAIYEAANSGGRTLTTLAADAAAGTQAARPLFYALPASPKPEHPSAAPLYDFAHSDGVHRAYSTEPAAPQGYQRQARPLCYVWQSPSRLALPRD
jgi:hypothetical protein